MAIGMGRATTALLVVLSVGGVSLLGCGEGVAESTPDALAAPRPEEMNHTDAVLYVSSTTLWRPLRVPVCWENPGTGDTTQRQWVRNAVARTWEARSGVRFNGWGTCGC